MRLIDVENYCKNHCRCTGCEKEKCPIWNAPTVEEVTMEWIQHLPKDSPYYTECSVCGFVLENMFCGENEVRYYEKGTNYCPNCGSKNREVANDK